MSFCYYCMKERTAKPNGDCPVCNKNIARSAQQQTAHALKPGTVLVKDGPYEIIVGTVLGSGGFGITYTALEKDNEKERRIALKEFFPKSYAMRGVDGKRIEVNSENRERFEHSRHAFEREARMLSKLEKSSNIIDVYFIISGENNTSYYGMEFFEGVNLYDYITKQSGPLEFSEAVQLLQPIFNGLNYCHGHGIRHRDVKPQNILIASGNQGNKLKLIDFGAAYAARDDITRSYQMICSKGYTPIEQITKDMEEGTFTDVYSLSATIYFMVTGRNPLDPEKGEENVKPPEYFGAVITPEQSQALMKGMARRPKDRIQTIPELWKAFNPDSNTSQPPPPPTPPSSTSVSGAQTTVKVHREGILAKLKKHFVRDKAAGDGSYMSLQQIKGKKSWKMKWRIHDRYVIGRDPKEAQVCLKSPDKSISRKHCYFIWNGSKWMIVDISKNGTAVNGKVIPGSTNSPLADGDTITVGEYVLKVIIR